MWFGQGLLKLLKSFKYINKFCEEKNEKNQAHILLLLQNYFYDINFHVTLLI